MKNINEEKKTSSHDTEDARKAHKRNKKLGYIILYISVLFIIVIGEVILFKIDPNASLWELFKDMIGNLMGVLAAFLVFDIVHEKITKDSYAAEVSEQILETMMYNQEVIDLYESDQKKVFINTFVDSVVEDEDATDMISNYLDNYLLTKKDYEDSSVSPRDCRIRTAFSYRFGVVARRKNAFSALQLNPDGSDPYFYVQEELSYTVKFLAEKGNNLNSTKVKYGFVFDNKSLDKALRENHRENSFENCIFRETLELNEVDINYIAGIAKEEVISMFRPHITIDGNKGNISNAEIAKDKKGNVFGIVFEFDVTYDVNTMQHDVDILFQMPKKWNSILEVCIVEPTKSPKISLSYNEDIMDVDMFSFLNKNDSTSYDNSVEEDNGVFSISISNEWVFPISGIAFFIKKKIDS